MATKPAAGKSGSAAAVLGKLASLGTVKKPAADAKAAKWEMELTPEATTAALRWIGAKAVSEPVEKRLEAARDEIGAYALAKMAEKLISNKSKPSNPLIIIRGKDGKAVDHQFQFSLQDKFKKFELPPDDVDVRDHFINALTGVGLLPNEAEKLVDNELDFSPIPEVKSPKDLLEGRYGEKREWIESTAAEKTAGQKLVALMLWDGTGDVPDALTPDEQALIIESRKGVTVKAGFYDRLATYTSDKAAISPKDQILGVFTVVKPIFSVAYLKFAVSDTDPDKARRKIEAAAEILGTVTTDSDD